MKRWICCCMVAVLLFGAVLTPYAEVQAAVQTKFCTSSTYDGASFKIFAKGMTMTVAGKAQADQTDYYFVIRPYEKTQVLFKKQGKIGSFGKFGFTQDLKSLKSGYYTFSIYYRQQGQKTYASTLLNRRFTVSSKKISFPVSKKTAANRAMLDRIATSAPRKYSSTHYLKEEMSAKQFAQMKTLAKTITKGAPSAYAKMEAVHDWVTQNIYYDMDLYRAGLYGDTDAASVYRSRKATCIGFAELTRALLLLSGVPCVLVMGKATWTDFSFGEATAHMWNAAYDGKRWVLLDTTWDTYNKAENNQLFPDRQTQVYFDPDLNTFSADHVIESYLPWYAAKK